MVVEGEKCGRWKVEMAWGKWRLLEFLSIKMIDKFYVFTKYFCEVSEMIQPKYYLSVRDKVFYTPLIKENLRLDFFSLEYKLNDLPLLIASMLRDGKTTDDIVAVTLLPRDVIENVFDELKSHGMLDEHDEYNLPEHTRKILELSDAINAFNLDAPPIFSDMLTKLPIINVARGI